jgi:hypothetical protein
MATAATPAHDTGVMSSEHEMFGPGSATWHLMGEPIL